MYSGVPMSSPLDESLIGRALDGARDPEVADHRPIGREENVVRLDITMENIPAVGIVECRRDVCGKAQDSMKREWSFPIDHGTQRFPSRMRHGEVDQGPCLV